MRPYRKKKRSERTTRAILLIASLAATLSFGLITPDENTSWAVILAFCASLQLTLILATISIPRPPDSRHIAYKSIFKGWLISEYEDKERERQREKDGLGFDTPDNLYPTRVRSGKR